MKDYTLILNYYNKSADLLQRQIEHIKTQTHPPKYTWGCFLGDTSETPNLINRFRNCTKDMNGVSIIHSSYNFKYTGRYQLALAAPTKYIITLDDDRLPMKDYCRKIIEIITERDCLVNQIGHRGLGGPQPELIDRVRSPIDDPGSLTEVDTIHGGMAFRKSSLTHLFKEEISDLGFLSGDDIMFCLRCKKNNVPPLVYQPVNKNEILHMDHENISSTANLQREREMLAKKELGIANDKPRGRDIMSQIV